MPASLYKVMIVSVADDEDLYRHIRIKDLPDNWRSMAGRSVLGDIGGKWYDKQESLVLKVPSVVIPTEYNYIINTRHPLFASKVHLVRTEDYFWDARLL